MMESLKQFDELGSQNNGTTNSHLKHIIEGLFGCFPLINALSKQMHTMRRTMRKPLIISFSFFAAQLMEINNYIPLFPGSSDYNKITLEDLN